MSIKAESNLLSISTTRPSTITWIAILILLTTMRGVMVTQLPSLQMFGGVNPDAWFTPWVSDTILGILAPFMAYIAFQKSGIKIWGLLLVYNAVGAFDYMHGIATQWTDPLIPNGMFGTPELTYGSIGFSLVVQLIVIILLFQREVVTYFSQSSQEGNNN